MNVEIDPTARIAIANMRSLAHVARAVAVDLNAAGIPAVATAGLAALLRKSADDFEASERAIAEAGNRD